MDTARLEKLFNMLKDEPGDSFLKYAIATEYVKLNDDQKALHYYFDILTNDENYVGAYYHLAKLYERIFQKDSAEQTYKKGMMIARKLNDNHAYAELQSAHNKLMGLDYEDD
jgi:Tfp pilus assembly protein PilF